MAYDLTPNQKLAIETTDKSIALSAGAGSGKTRVLVLRYLHLLETRLAKVDEILAITFTNKAAGEMKERIMHEVLKHAQNAPTPGEKDFWRSIKEDLNHAQISTFHSFCGQVLRDNPLYSQVDPYFVTLEELKAEELLTETVEEILLGGLDANEPNIFTLTREFGIRYIDALLKNAYLNSRGRNLPTIAALSTEKLHESEARLSSLKAEIADLSESLITINHTEKLAAGTKARLDELATVWPTLAEKIANLHCLADSDRRALVKLREILKGNLAKTVTEQAKRIRTIIDEEIDQYFADARSIELIDPLITVLKTIDHRYREKKAQLNGLDFADLEEKTIAIFKAYPEFAIAYQKKYKFIMVDEFQDTNPDQEELIRLITGGSSTANLTGAKLFIVGDPKQSIYRFRGADVTVFKRLKEEISNIGQAISLDLNFRSKEQIIEFTNHFFQDIFGTSPNIYDMPYERAGFVRKSVNAESCVEFLILDEVDLQGETDKRAEEAEQLARRIKGMVLGQEPLVYEGAEIARPVKYGDICILFQALTNIPTYEQALQKYSIPYTVVNGRGFFERTEICDILNLLKIIDNQHREIEWAGVLRSPFCGLSDEDLYWISIKGPSLSQAVLGQEEIPHLSKSSRTRLQEFVQILHTGRAKQDRLEISILLNTLLTKTGYLQLVLASPDADLIKANLEKLISMARTYEEDTYASLAGFIRHIERMEKLEAREGLAQVPGQQEMVKLMSIHQSKGLEFPVVILPDTQRGLINPTYPAIFFDPHAGIGMRLRDPLDVEPVKTSIYTTIVEEEKRREIAERKRLFYVAATRAKDYLLISGTMKGFKTTTIDEERSWLDWLCHVFKIAGPAPLPETLAYGSADQYRIRLTPRLAEIILLETAATHEVIAVDEWQAMYQNPSLASIKPRRKTGLVEFSVSELQTYKECPRWYYHRYIQRMPENIATPLRGMTHREVSEILWENDAIESQITEGLPGQKEKGTLIHFLCQRGKSESELPELVKKGLLQRGFTPNQQMLTGILTTVTPYMEAFFRREAELRQSLDPTKLVDEREVKFNLVLQNSLIRGTIDRVLITPDEAIIIDYKSNDVGPANLPQTALRYQLQMEIYALAIYQLTGRTKVKSFLHFLKPDLYWQEDFTPDKFVQITDNVNCLIGEIIGAVQNNMSCPEFPCQTEAGLVCKYCSYESLCKKVC